MKNQNIVIGALIAVIVIAIVWIGYASTHKPAPDASAFKVPPPSSGAQPAYVQNKKIPIPAATLGGAAPQGH